MIRFFLVKLTCHYNTKYKYLCLLSPFINVNEFTHHSKLYDQSLPIQSFNYDTGLTVSFFRTSVNKPDILLSWMGDR